MQIPVIQEVTEPAEKMPTALLCQIFSNPDLGPGFWLLVTRTLIGNSRDWSALKRPFVRLWFGRNGADTVVGPLVGFECSGPLGS